MKHLCDVPVDVLVCEVLHPAAWLKHLFVVKIAHHVHIHRATSGVARDLNPPIMGYGENAAVKEMMMQCTECHSVRNKVRTIVGVPLNVRGFDADVAVPHMRLKAAHRASPGVGIEDLELELWIAPLLQPQIINGRGKCCSGYRDLETDGLEHIGVERWWELRLKHHGYKIRQEGRACTHVHPHIIAKRSHHVVSSKERD